LNVKIPNGLLIIDIICLFLIIIINFLPDSIWRIILGLPLLFFFPGYGLTKGLFVNNSNLNYLERMSLYFGLSIVVVPLIGLILNYTHIGIKLMPLLYSVIIFVLLTSLVAFFREGVLLGENNLVWEIKFEKPDWGESQLHKFLALILVVLVAGTIGALSYTIAFPNTGEKYSEFYVLGKGNIADNYPTDFMLAANQIVGISYDKGNTFESKNIAQVTIGIINLEQQPVTYGLSIQINGQPTPITYYGNRVELIEEIILQPAEKWEHEVGFTPVNLGENQKVEFLLKKENLNFSSEAVHFWINVRSQS
jgi:uncharacterized membrane protein